MDKQLNTSRPAAPVFGLPDGQAFAGDMFQRRAHAERLTAYIERIRDGCVLAIDARWGEGKTWFGRNWAAALHQVGHKVVFIDAAEQDYVEDPFLLLAAEIADALDNGHGSVRALREAAAGVMKLMSPAAACRGNDTSAAWPAAAGAGAIDERGKWIEWKLENHAHEKASFQQFRNALAAAAAGQARSLVLFIDELDRCQPAFALRLIERLKHLFDVPNLVFVVLIDRDALQRTVGRLYGLDGEAAAAYLRQFVNFCFALPERAGGVVPGSASVQACVERVFSRYSFDESCGPAIFKLFFSWTAAWFNLSVRDIERATALYAYAYPVNQHNYLLPYVITLKVGKPELFRRLEKGGDMEAHREALDFLKPIRGRTALAQPYRYLSLLMEWHEAHIVGFSANGASFTLRLREFDQRSGEPILWCDLHPEDVRDGQRTLFQLLAELIDGTN